MKKGDKSLVGNKGYRRFLATHGDDRFVIDRAKAEEDVKFDGVFVLRTNAVSRRSKRCFATSNYGGWNGPSERRRACSPRGRSISSTRPFAATSRAVSCPRAEKGARGPHRQSGQANCRRRRTEGGSWPDIVADLNSLTETEVEQDGKRFLLRSTPRPAASLALRATGVALPPTVGNLQRLIPIAIQ